MNSAVVVLGLDGIVRMMTCELQHGQMTSAWSIYSFNGTI